VKQFQNNFLISASRTNWLDKSGQNGEKMKTSILTSLSLNIFSFFSRRYVNEEDLVQSRVDNLCSKESASH
jgi:hypothetical protein